jgi:hypothetical protein
MTNSGQPPYQIFADLSLNTESAVSDAAGRLISALPFCGRAVGLQGLAWLASTSKQMRRECIDYITQQPAMLLTDAMAPVRAVDDLAAAAEAAGAEADAVAAAGKVAPPRADQRLPPMVLWLLRVAPGVAANAQAADVLQRLLRLPCVPLEQAQQLVAAGVRIRYGPLLAAARSMVAGVEVWVRAQHELGISTDIPAAAVAICCGQSWVSAHPAGAST